MIFFFLGSLNEIYLYTNTHLAIQGFGSLLEVGLSFWSGAQYSCISSKLIPQVGGCSTYSHRMQGLLLLSTGCFNILPMPRGLSQLPFRYMYNKPNIPKAFNWLIKYQVIAKATKWHLISMLIDIKFARAILFYVNKIPKHLSQVD